MTKRRDCLTESLYIQPKRIFCLEEKTRPGKLSYDFYIRIQTNPTGLAQEFQISDILYRIRHRLHRVHIGLCGIIGNHPETRVNISALYREMDNYEEAEKFVDTICFNNLTQWEENLVCLKGVLLSAASF